jgi:16S rRNA processing protein RimM
LHVAKDQLPHLPAGDYYWNQLIGLKVYTQVDGSDVELGEIASMMETGANDVVVISATASSVDNQERLIPYLVGQFVLKIDLEENRMDVDWDPEF